MKRLLLTIALLATSSAFAADAQVKAPQYRVVAAPVFNWTGFYGGVHADGAWGKSDFGGFVATDLGGYGVGLQAGYNWQFAQNYVLGVHGSYTHADINGGLSILGGLISANHNVDQMYDVGVRLGFLVTPRTMVYGGLAYGWADATATIGIGGANDAASATHKGLLYRVGLEHYFSENLSMFGEYRFGDLDPENYTFNAIGATVSTSLEVSAIRVGLNYKFNSF